MATIVIADDDNDVCELLAFMLERDGHTVIDVHDGEMVFPLVEKEKPDLVILDVMMPNLDGYSVASKLYENLETKKIPIIVLTAKEKTKELFQALSNVALYVNKPFEPAVLRTMVREVLERKK
ncbi:MAG: response regulator [bacterium]